MLRISRIILLSSMLFLSACSTNPSSTKPVEVLVPVQVPCKITSPNKPSFAVDNLGIGEDIFEKVKALLAERKQRQGYELELEEAIKACNE